LGLDAPNRSQQFLVVDDDDLVVLHVMGRGRPTSSLKDLPQILPGHRTLPIKRDPRRMPLLHEFQDVSHGYVPSSKQAGNEPFQRTFEPSLGAVSVMLVGTARGARRLSSRFCQPRHTTTSSCPARSRPSSRDS